MSENEKDYSDYIQHLSNMGQMYTFLSGFMFTAITILLIQLPEPSSLMAQLALLFMVVFLDIFVYYMGFIYHQVLRVCRNLPSFSGERSFANVMSDLSVVLGLGGSTVLLFLLMNLIYLGIVQLIAWGFTTLAIYNSYGRFWKRQKRA